MTNLIIINADDCGKNYVVNREIERFIKLGKITSTTVMANMEDLQGAKNLYDKYKDSISFGIHLNLTEGTPLLECKELEEYGFYKRVNGILLFNGKNYYNKILPHKLWKFVEQELEAQIKKIIDVGIIPSHIDSHNHIHTSPCLLFIAPRVVHKAGITKCRRMRNIMPSGFSCCIRNLWARYFCLASRVKSMSDYFCSFTTFFYGVQIKEGSVIEIMCHPGGIYPEEDKLILNANYKELFANSDLINYNQL